jgi:cell division protein FtsB
MNRSMSILVTCLILIGAAALFAVLVQSGFREQRRAEERRDQLARLVEQLEVKKLSLEKEREGLQGDPAFVEREARRLLGYIKEDEKAIERPPAQPSGGPGEGGKEGEAPRQAALRPWLEQMRGFIGTWQMTLAVVIVILIALAVAWGFGGRPKPAVSETLKKEQPKL